MGSLADQDSAVNDFLEILEEHRKNCERLGKYVEAEIARKRMEELRAHEEARKREALRARQLAEVLAVEEAHMMEFQQFNAMWDAKMQAFEQNAEQLMGAMRERHADELRDFQQRLVAKATQPRHSKEYYNLREIQEKLAHQKNYAAAAKMKDKADELMAYEEEKWNNEKQMDMLHRENVFKGKLASEAEALRKRIAQGRAEQNRARQLALERLLQRYNNVKAELEQNHKLERMRFDRELATEAKAREGRSAAPRSSAKPAASSGSSTGGATGSAIKAAGSAVLGGSRR